MSTTPVGDWLAEHYGRDTTHWLGADGKPGCEGYHARCAYLAGRAEALGELAAEFDESAVHYDVVSQAAAGHAGSALLAGAFRQAADMARERLPGSPGATESARSVSLDGREAPGGSQPRDAAVRAGERERIARLAGDKHACYVENGHAHPFADLIREQP